jgi:hypothetical protein
MEGAYSSLSFTIVMVERCQKSKRLSCMANFKCEVIRCTEKGNCKAAAIFGADESNARLWHKHKAAIRGCEASLRKFTGPKKGRFPEIDDAVFTFFQESYDLLHKEAIMKARSLNIPQSRFKASKGWAIRFMCQMGLALRRRMMICQKFPKDFEHLYHISKIQLSTANLICTRL